MLVVNPIGLLQLLYSDLPINAPDYLADTGDGPYVGLAITVDGDEGGMVHFLADDTAPLNPRARDVLARLTGVHVVLTGTVTFTGVPPERLVEFVREVG